MREFLDHMMSVPTWWQIFELIWLAGLAWYGYYLHTKEGWFQTPFNTTAMFWEIPLAGALTAFLTTDFQLEGLFIVMKWHYFREWMRQDKLFGATFMILLASVLLFLLFLSPIVGI